METIHILTEITKIPTILTDLSTVKNTVNIPEIAITYLTDISLKEDEFTTIGTSEEYTMDSEFIKTLTNSIQNSPVCLKCLLRNSANSNSVFVNFTSFNTSSYSSILIPNLSNIETVQLVGYYYSCEIRLDLDVTLNNTAGRFNLNARKKIYNNRYSHSSLLNLKSQAALVPGNNYVIYDYSVTSKSTGTPYWKAASNQLACDLILTATSNNSLAPEGIMYVPSLLRTYKIWYDINKTGWTNGPNSNGLIYRMIDDKGNDCPFDFKNIVRASDSHYMFGVSNGIVDGSLNYCSNNVITAPTNGNLPTFTLSILEDPSSEDSEGITLRDNYISGDAKVTLEENMECYWVGNKILSGTVSLANSENCTVGKYCSTITLNSCSNCTIEDSCLQITLSDVTDGLVKTYCSNITCNKPTRNLVVGAQQHNITITGDYSENITFDDMHEITATPATVSFDFGTLNNIKVSNSLVTTSKAWNLLDRTQTVITIPDTPATKVITKNPSGEGLNLILL